MLSLVMTFGPIVFATLTFLALSASRRWRTATVGRQTQKTFFNFLLLGTFFIYPSTSTVLFQTFRCEVFSAPTSEGDDYVESYLRADLRLAWFEEPVVPELLDAYVEIRARQPIPVAGGETWHGRTGFAEAIARRAVDILQPDVCGCGGITEMRKIVWMAETAGIRVPPHVWGTGVALAASLHMLAILPPTPPRHAERGPLLEFDQTYNPYRAEILVDPVAQSGGMVAIPQGPGLGVEINRAALARYTVEG